MSDPQHGITTAHGHGGPGHHGAAVAVPFGEADLAEFHKNDIQAGGAIIVLMTAIFTIGLILYSVIAVVVAG